MKLELYCSFLLDFVSICMREAVCFGGGGFAHVLISIWRFSRSLSGIWWCIPCCVAKDPLLCFFGSGMWVGRKTSFQFCPPFFIVVNLHLASMDLFGNIPQENLIEAFQENSLWCDPVIFFWFALIYVHSVHVVFQMTCNTQENLQV